MNKSLNTFFDVNKYLYVLKTDNLSFGIFVYKE